MTPAEAKLILTLYRPSGQDAADLYFAEALREAKRDPILGAWFAFSRAFDALIAAKLKEVAPPIDLRDAILAGDRMARASRTVGSESPSTLASFFNLIMRVLRLSPNR